MHTPRALRTRFNVGFTLVELLVTLSIITVLLGLLLPTLRSMQRQATATADLSNLRSLMQAHLAYMNIYHERFVDVGLPHGTPSDQSLSFVHKLKPFLGSGTLAVKSPLDQSPHWKSDEGGEGTPVIAGPTPVWRQTSYGMNNYLSRTVSPWVALTGPTAASDCLAAIERPEATVCFLLMSETGPYASADHPHVEEWGAAPHPARQAAGQCMINAIDRNRASTDSRSNYAFLDGHVAAQRFDDVFKHSTNNMFDPEVQR